LKTETRDNNYAIENKKEYLKKYCWKEYTLLIDLYFASYIGNFSKEATENDIRSQD
jgi:hypothetical protein